MQLHETGGLGINHSHSAVHFQGGFVQDHSGCYHFSRTH